MVVEQAVIGWPSANRLVESTAGVAQPGVDVLAPGGQHHSEGPTVMTGGAGMEEVEAILRKEVTVYRA
jgi:hypothetical protein